MKHPIVLCLLFVALTTEVIGGNFLSEKPDILNPCMLKDTGFNRCFAKNVQVIFHEWKDGIPGLESTDSLDPFFIKRVIIPQDHSSPVSLDIDLYNVMLSGISGTIVDDASFDPSSVVAKFRLIIPKMDITSDYSIKGRILNIALSGNGKSYIIIENSEIYVVVHLKLRDEDNFTFIDVDKLRLEVKEVDGLRIRLDNLFHGQQVLEESTNEVFSEHWHDFYEVLQPSIKMAIEATMNQRFSTVFAHIPATFFIKDIPTAAEHAT